MPAYTYEEHILYFAVPMYIKRSGRVFAVSFVGFFMLFYVLFGHEAFSFNFFSAWTSKKNQLVGE